MPPLPDLSRRRLRPERMDDPDLPAAEHRKALAGLARIHAVDFSDRLLWRPVAELARARGGPLTVLDLACGGGDLTLALARRAAAAGLPIRVAGCDLSPTAVERAREAAAARGLDVPFFTHDALAGPPALTDTGQPYDVLTCSLFLHHLDEERAVALLTRMREQAGAAVLVHDLLRSKAGWLLAWLASRVLSTSPVVRTDALLSVEGALSFPEVGFLMGRAGMHRSHTAVTTHWPERWLLHWRR
jgi:SAM-dependent methyltransferase